MNRRQAYVIISLLAVVAVVLAVLLGYLLGSGDGPEAETLPESSTSSSSPLEPTETPVQDPAEVLETAGIDVVREPPVPEAPPAWGDSELGREWRGQVRVFEDGPAEPARGPDQSGFPASMNGCGTLMYFVTFRPTGRAVTIDAQLVDAVGAVRDSKRLTGGWMLGTNCSTPHFAFRSAEGETDFADVAYTVYEYRQTSVARPTAGPAPTAAAQPSFVECLFGTPGPARFSDGSVRNHLPCTQTPEAQRSLKGERVCGGLYGWKEVSREEYLDLCSATPPSEREATSRARVTTPSQTPSQTRAPTTAQTTAPTTATKRTTNSAAETPTPAGDPASTASAPR